MAERIVGREVELAAVDEVLAAVRSGPAGLLLEGPAGVGKTTLWQAAVGLASDAGLRVLSCRPGIAETRLSYSGLDDLLGGAVGEVAGSLPGPQRRALDVVLLHAATDGAGPDARTVSRAVLEVVRMLAASGPVVLAVDDVQWLDRPSVEVLEYVLRRLSDEPVAVVLAWRSAASAPVPLGVERLSWWAARVRRVTVGPLSVGALHGVVQGHLELSLPRQVLVRVHEASGGNPFYALEIARSLIELGRELPPGEPLPIPSSLVELVAGRLARLPRSVREVLLVVSAVGRPTMQLLGAAVGVDRARSAVEHAMRAGVLVAGRDRLEFVHPLVGSGVYAGATPWQRETVHRRLAELVADPEERARHLALAAVDPDDQVAEVLDAAAGVALSRGSPSTAAEFYEHAVRLTPPCNTVSLQRRRLEAARCHGTAGNTGRGRELAHQVVDSAVAGVVRAEALLLLGGVMFCDDVPEALDVLGQALHDSGDTADLQSEALYRLFSVHLGRWDVEAAASHARAALTAAEGAGTVPAMCAALVAVGRIAVIEGRPAGVELVERAAALQPMVERGRIASAPSGWVATLLRWMDDFDGARVRLEPLLRLADDVGEDDSVGELLYELSELERWAGNWQLAWRYARDAVEIHRLAGRRWELSAALAALACVDAHLGRVDSARAAAAEGLAITRAIGGVDETVRNLCALGFLELSLSRPRQALDSLAEVASVTAAVEEPGVLRYAGDHIEALIGVGDLDAADIQLTRLERQAQAVDRAWALAVAARCRALLLLASGGDVDAALAAADEALAHQGRVAMPFEHARTLLVAGIAQRRAKRLTEAHLILVDAQSLFDRLGAPIWAATAARELERIGGHLGRRRPRPRELSPTERRVAELVTAGASNPEVAAALFISRRTVEDHLSKIYRKLDVRSRTELAHRMATEDLTATP